RVGTVDVEERQAVEQIRLYGLAVVDIHELARDEPSGNAALGHPGVGQAEEMAVEPCKAADLHPAGLLRVELQAVLVAVLQVMVADVGRIADDEIEAGRGLRARKVGELDYQAGVIPEVRGGNAIVRVDLETESFYDALRRQSLRERRIERAGAYSRVEKMYFLGRRQKANSVSQHVFGKRRGRRKLTE